MSAISPQEERIGKTIEEWYSNAYKRGVRLSGVERQLLARFLAQREIALRKSSAEDCEDPWVCCIHERPTDA